VYVHQVDEQVLTFQVSGKLWMRSLVMRDVETKSEWSHLLGRAMAGELKGKTLKPLITDMVTWDAWKRDSPDTTVLDMPNTSQHYTSEFYRDPSKFVFGFDLGGDAWAIEMNKLIERPVHSFRNGDRSLLATFDKQGVATRLFESDVDGQSLDFVQLDDQVMQDTQTKSRWKISTGAAIDGPLAGKRLKQRVGIMSFRRAWDKFFPDSTNVKF
jgi:hypothetical protein